MPSWRISMCPVSALALALGSAFHLLGIVVYVRAST